MDVNEATKKTLQGLLRDELIAVEIYGRALRTIGDASGARLVSRIHHEHCMTVDALRGVLTRYVGEEGISKSAGRRGTMARVATRTAGLLGDHRTLRVLRQSEAQSLTGYRRILEHRLATDARNLIQAHLLPRARSNLDALDRLIRGRAQAA